MLWSFPLIQHVLIFRLETLSCHQQSSGFNTKASNEKRETAKVVKQRKLLFFDAYRVTHKERPRNVIRLSVSVRR